MNYFQVFFGWKTWLLIGAHIAWYIGFWLQGTDITASSPYSKTFSPNSHLVPSTVVSWVYGINGILTSTIFVFNYDQFRKARDYFHQMLGVVLNMALAVRHTKVQSVNNAIHALARNVLEAMVSHETTRVAKIDALFRKTEETIDRSQLSNAMKLTLVNHLISIVNLDFSISAVFINQIPLIIRQVYLFGTMFSFCTLVPVMWSVYSYLFGTAATMVPFFVIVGVLDGMRVEHPIFSRSSNSYSTLQQLVEKFEFRLEGWNINSENSRGFNERSNNQEATQNREEGQLQHLPYEGV